MSENLDLNQKSNGIAVASLVTGIVSIVLCWAPLVGLVCGILGIVFYVKTKKAIDNGEMVVSAKGMATGGLVTGIIGLTFSFFYNIVWVIMLFAASAASSVRF